MATYWENSCIRFHKYLIANLGFWSGNLFLVAPFPDHCLLLPLYIIHSASILELSTNLFLKFYKSAFDIDALLSNYHPGVVLSIWRFTSKLF